MVPSVAPIIAFLRFLLCFVTGCSVTKYASSFIYIVVCVLKCYYAITCEFTVFVVSSEFPCQGLSVISGLDYWNDL